MEKKTGVLFINVGTPDSADPGDVGRYLNEFLMDPYVVDIPAPMRWILVKALIVPRRKFASAELYRKVWKPEGSPLLIHLQNLVAATQRELGDAYSVRGGMRYGSPGIASAVRAFKREGIDKITLFPLYPQYSLAATETSIRETERIVQAEHPKAELSLVRPFYAEPEFLEACAEVYGPPLKAARYDRVLFSFHGLPERQVKKTDDTGKHCLALPNCSEAIVDANRNCYRAQSFATARLLAEKLGIAKDGYDVCFQSRLGRTPWIRPYTDELYSELPKRGVKRIAVVSPSFVADCLETLEEISLRGAEQFRDAGGESLTYIPSLNSQPAWVRAAAHLIKRFAM